MPRTKTIKTSEENMDDNLPAVKQMVRWLGGATDDSGHDAVQTVDLELTEWINKGYHLFATHFVGLSEGTFGVLYILVKDA